MEKPEKIYEFFSNVEKLFFVGFSEQKKNFFYVKFSIALNGIF